MEIIEYHCPQHGMVEMHARSEASTFSTPEGCPIGKLNDPCGLPLHFTSSERPEMQVGG